MDRQVYIGGINDEKENNFICNDYPSTIMCLTMSVYADGEGANGFGNPPEETEIENAEKNVQKKQ